MTDQLRALAESHGIVTRYRSETGEPVEIEPETLTALLETLSIDPNNGPDGHFADEQHDVTRSCFLPEALRDWGITCQLYALRSDRNLGIGDFEDLARLCEIAGPAGAAFVGVNPVHALFLANPGHYSPYSPSTRRFLNPLCIAVDTLPGGAEAIEELRGEAPELFEALAGDLVDYVTAGKLKARVLRRVFERLEQAGDADLQAFRLQNGESLAAFALFEAISEKSVADGGPAGWHGWPQAMQDRTSPDVARFAKEHASAVRFHEWLQFVADRQLGEAQARARAAGMSIGLYLDFAVGVSPDGADTWTDPALTVGGARVGSPPDLFNSAGQDWGLAPLSPETLAERAYRPLRDAYQALMHNAGAIRIDHAMGLARLWWIPHATGAAGGSYVRYPLGAMADSVAEASAANRCIVIGEDLGTVPEGFRAAVETADILSYRVLYFERDGGGFVAPGDYPERALACISTHDLATLAGWWTGDDIRLRSRTGRQSEKATARDLAAREGDKAALAAALSAERLATPELLAALEAGTDLPATLSEDLAIAIHRYGARTRAMLFAVQIDDILGTTAQANLPGTTDEYPNWRIRTALSLESLADDPRFQAFTRAMREERPETR